LIKCAKCAGETGDEIRMQAIGVIMQLRMFFAPVEADAMHPLIRDYLLACAPIDRLRIYQAMWSDMAFLDWVLPTMLPPSNLVMSLYVPHFSVFFSTLHAIFLENKQDGIRLVLATLNCLTSTIEAYANADDARRALATLFPLLPMIFTFYDSLVNNGGGQAAVAGPLLCILRHVDRDMFMGYWRMLSLDNQLRFLDVLGDLVNSDTVKDMSLKFEGMQGHVLTCAYEITWRILLFLRGFDHKGADPRVIERFFHLIMRVLLVPTHSADLMYLLLKFLVFLIKQHNTETFTEGRPTVLRLTAEVCRLTQRKLAMARLNSVAFITWLIWAEHGYHKSTLTCHNALQYAVSVRFVTSDNYVPFIKQIPEKRPTARPDYLPKVVENAVNLEDELVSIRTKSKTIEGQILEFHKLSLQYANFISVRANLYAHIVELNKRNGDLFSAFVMQWRLCALICEAFALQKRTVRGLPRDGFKSFLFVFDEAPIDLRRFPPPSGFIVLQSDMFTEDYIAKAMQEALSLSEAAGLKLILRKVAEYLFRFLEARRQFVLLADLYDIVTSTYEGLATSEQSELCFTRVFIGEAGQATAQFKEAIRISTSATRKSIKSLEAAGLIVLEKQRDPVTQHPGAVMSITKVHCDQAALLAMKVSSFYKDVVVAPDCAWKETYATRYIYETVRPLPSFVSFVEIKSTKAQSITKEDYFIEQLTAFQKTFQRTVDSLAAVMPHEKMKPQWGQCPLGVSTTPVLDLLLSVTQDETTQKNGRPPYFELVLSKRKGNLLADVPPKLADLVEAIWGQLGGCVQIIGETQTTNKADPADVEKLERVKGMLAPRRMSTARSTDMSFLPQ
jgi:hypothetical protein